MENCIGGAILGGENNIIYPTSPYAFIGGGKDAILYDSNYAAILGGLSSEVSKSDYSSLMGGNDNTIKDSDYAFIGAGRENNITLNSHYSFIGGGYQDNIYNSDNSIIAGGLLNTISCYHNMQGNSILAGYGNTIQSTNWGGTASSLGGQYNTILGGFYNEISGSPEYSFIGGGRQNLIRTTGGHNNVLQNSTITAGQYNHIINTNYSGIFTGRSNVIGNLDGETWHEYSTIVGGRGNVLTSSNASTIVGGLGNLIKKSDWSAIVVGSGSKISPTSGDSTYNFIGGGKANTISSTEGYNAILGGDTNVIGGAYTDTFIIGSNITAAASNTTYTENLSPGTDDSFTLGTSALRWDDVFAVQTTTGGIFESGLKTQNIGDNLTGTIVVWQEDKLIPCDTNEDELVMGVIKHGKDEPIVLGAEPVLVTGKVQIGDYIVTSDKLGHGKSVKRGYLLKKDLFGKVIAQALEKSDDSESCLIRCMIRKM
tara:strand:+ start:8 stop:1456 length:1449 start_codon:yes stop_codon:yes gene_type:complete